MIAISIIGNTNYTGKVEVDENKSLIDICKQDANGMAGDKKLFIAQVGGPLGTIVRGNDLLNTLSDYNLDQMQAVMFMNEQFCPVDFARFMTAYIRRELVIRDKDVNALFDIIEKISSGNTGKYTLAELEDELDKVAESKNDIVKNLRINISYLYYNFKDIFVSHAFNKKCAASICHKLFAAQCINECPAEINIPGYVALMYNNQDELAYKLMRERNPLSFVCGKVCARPCETRCRRGEIEKTVGVRALKHYAATKGLENKITEETLPPNGKKIAIIGSGPAGLTSAYFLSKAGYSVEIFEKYPVVGGMLALGIPSYRLSQESINKEVELIENLGVVIHTNTEVGKDIQFEDIREKFDFTLLATGSHIANQLNAQADNLESALDFLRNVKLENKKSVGKNVVVIGGGDVAMDSARTAIRLGAETVTVISLETLAQMPANDEEKEEATKEGILFKNGFGVKSIKKQGDLATGLILKKCLELYNLENEFAPIYDDQETLEISCDHIILAIGQKADLSYLNNKVQKNNKGQLVLDPSWNNVICTGDMVKPGSAIKAIADARLASIQIDRLLCNTGMFKENEIEIPTPQILYNVWDTTAQTEHVCLYSKNNSENPFDENRAILGDQEVRIEAFRCMRCDRNSRK